LPLTFADLATAMLLASFWIWLTNQVDLKTRIQLYVALFWALLLAFWAASYR
jgi:hypothetical protein